MPVDDLEESTVSEESCTYVVGGRRSCRSTPVVADYITQRGREGEMRFPLCEEHTKPEHHPPGLRLADR